MIEKWFSYWFNIIAKHQSIEILSVFFWGMFLDYHLAMHAWILYPLKSKLCISLTILIFNKGFTFKETI
ncbi:hypothetical protein BpHYR1_015615 [Brachionus plicatilis]|uniref:Uncharacterized protein n=1 Tax=Brachionus plicatilis TaxID=10195 RepID=A0A3M7PRJ7_BRAPC|nr:hypothetical protein BpHYR1_015615 [Brachionus plicatilis]